MKLIIGITLAVLSINQVQADAPLLTVKPQKCVALKKGQICYQTLRFTFESPEPGNFCLHVRDRDAPLHCWEEQSTMEYRYRMASKSDLNYFVTDALGNSVASAKVSVAWVYKRSRKRNRWRLF